MKWIWMILAIALLLGPLRRWMGRHWALGISVIAGAVFGYVLGALVTGPWGGSDPHLPLIWGLVGAIASGNVGPRWLRHISEDGKK